MKRRILAFISIFVMLFTASCNFSDGSENYMTVRTDFGNDYFCYETSVSSKEIKKIKKILLSDEWVFDYNEELKITSKYKIYSGDESFFVAPDTDYVFLRVAEGETFEWRKADKNSDIAKKALELLSDIENKYCPVSMPSGWINYCLYRPDEEGVSPYYARIIESDAKTLSDALESIDYERVAENMAIELAVQYKVTLDGKQYYVTNTTDKVFIESKNGTDRLQKQISADSDVAKQINEILEKTVDIEPTFRCE